MPSIRKTLVAALMAFPAAMGHSWGEQLRNIDDKGNYVGQYGYPRGFVDRGSNAPGSGDAMSYRVNEGRAYINKDDMVCPPTQREQKQANADKFPRLKSPPGGYVAIRYQENGHVTSADTNPEKPEKGGTIFVYGTKEPKPDDKLVDVLQWTKDGQGGDKRGVLLAMTDYDDGRCYLNNGSPKAKEREQFSPAYAMGSPQSGPSNTVMYCETDVKLPDTMELSKAYTLYWVWQWASMPGRAGFPKEGKDEYFTTCMDIDAASADVAMAAEAPEAMAKFQMLQQDGVTTAHPDFKSRTALFTDSPFKREYGPVTSEISLPGGGSGSGDAPFPTNSTPPAGPTAPVTTSAIPVPSAAPPAPSNSPPISAIVPSATAQLPSPSNSAASSATMEIPTLSGRPGAAPTPPAGDNGVVTVTDTVMVTVTAPAPTAPVATPPAPPAVAPPAITPRAVHSIYHRNGAKFRGL
ncbi:uncharacterized protein J4E88_007247 [Alternaria novae-zelandiae]|uniref:uncharacterized protein n=1 Tax=Alternaria novae-zelandiae TaxID=430562 RepID=UPI0020C45E11|nr:uncharacterized protein J4E88_007247 [Alternaria novae-zelandiae]XP_051350242.1 uncharacterized protein J4E92_008102 [Alternaria infectoria]KAI4676333.1 hypothetical protein J4E88_007247 [Alternaria novae-zelandiae]KAI4921117.1 hypothetical protein J4E92_008102 [Alternaria infectoria]